MEAKTTTRTALGYLMTANFRTLKGRFTRYDFVARDNFTTGLRHVLGPLIHANDIFTYKIKYAKVCTGIYGAKVLTNDKKIFQLSCALKKLSNKMFFALIRSVLFEKLLMRISRQQVRPPF